MSPERCCTWTMARMWGGGEPEGDRMRSKRQGVATFAALLAAMFTATPGANSQGKGKAMEQQVFYRTVKVDGLKIFYREAGPKDAPTILLLHGLPSSSRMFQTLRTRLSDHYHLVVPDYPGFGHSDWPEPREFAYTFDHIAAVIEAFTNALGLMRYTLYMRDYGVPVGFRMVLKHPERVHALIVQDAHNEGLGANWVTRRAFWTDRAANDGMCRTRKFMCWMRGTSLGILSRTKLPAWCEGSCRSKGERRPALLDARLSVVLTHLIFRQHQ